MKRRILLVDDEVAILLTLKAVLEISGFDVDTAASARDAKSRLKTRVYDMVITDMRMENDEAGREVIAAARSASYHPAVTLLTAFPVAEEDWQDMGADKMLVKPMHVPSLIRDLEKLYDAHKAKLARLEAGQKAPGKDTSAKTDGTPAVAAKKTAATKKTVVKNTASNAASQNGATPVKRSAAAVKTGTRSARKPVLPQAGM